VLAIVLLEIKKFLRTEEVFRSLTLSSRRLLELTITMTPSHLGPSPTMGSSLHGVDLEVADRTSGTYWSLVPVRQLCSDAFQRRVYVQR